MKQSVLNAITSETDYQLLKHGEHHHSVGEWILVMEKCLRDAKTKWQTCRGDDAALHEVRQVAACAVQCMTQHYAPHRGVPIQNHNGQPELPQYPANRTETAPAAS
jgi:hypothetical protein